MTGQRMVPAGTHSRTILNRLLIGLSRASSHLEGNNYTARYPQPDQPRRGVHRQGGKVA